MTLNEQHYMNKHLNTNMTFSDKFKMDENI